MARQAPALCAPLFDALVVILSDEGARMLAMEGASIEFVRDAFGHLTAIAVDAGGEALLESARGTATQSCKPDRAVPTDTEGGRVPVGSWCMFQLVTTVKRGSASPFPQSWLRYPSVEAARAAATVLLREDRVQRVMIVRSGLQSTFVEWCV